MNDSHSTTNSTLTNEQLSLLQLDNVILATIFILSMVVPMTAFINLGILYILLNGGQVFKSHYYRLFRHMCTISALVAVYLFIHSGAVRIIQTVFRIPDSGTMINCSYRYIVLEVIMIVDRYNVLILALDRFIAAAFPFQYKTMQMSSKYIYGSIGAPYIIGLTYGVALKYAFYTNDFMNKILLICQQPNTKTPEVLSFLYYEGMVNDLMIIITYLSAILLVIHKIRSHTGNVQQLKKELGVKLMTVCACDAGAHVCTYFFSNLFGATVFARTTIEARVALSPFTLLFNLSSSTLRFIILYKLNADFKQQVKKRFCFRLNTVTPMQTT